MSSGGSISSLLIFLLPLLLIGWMILSQRKRQRQVAALQDSLAVGDEVCTTSGLFGRITALEAAAVTLEVSPGVNVRYDRRAVGMRVGEPADSGRSSGQDEQA
jgi:preprotein translocase subunit YajC